MVAAAEPRADAPARPPGPVRAALTRALATVLECLPALLLAWLCLRLLETWHAGAAGLRVSVLFGPALANDLLALARHGAVFLAGGLLLAPIRQRRWRVLALGVVWSLLLALEAALVAYHWSAGVPLGADLFGYSRAEIATTLGAGAGLGAGPMAGLALALAVLWSVLLASSRPWWPRASLRPALAACGCGVLAWCLLPEHFAPPVAASEASVDYLRNKMAYFVDRSLAHVADSAGAARREGGLPWSGKDPRHPFLHVDRTPDTLGPLFDVKPGAPPNLVFIVVEGLGRDFSGPGARLGSFTPFLDELAGRSLYFENFLAGQGRTFGVLSTLFASMPFGENGMEALGARIPRHASLLSVLKTQGYRLSYYSGSNLVFDNQGQYLRGEGVDTLVGEQDFGPPHVRSNDWGYADRDLVEVALQHQQAEARARTGEPTLAIIQTTSMHDPFTFPDSARYLARVGARLAALGIDKAANPAYTAQPQIFASILYTDDALRLYFEEAKRLPGYANTIFIITGDHRLPELPMDTRISRYHVPLIVYSPLLKKPAAIKAVSSQFDVAPSLLAFLGHGYGLRVPAQAAWMGTGLDLDPAFRNLHAIPLKQTKTELSDFVSGSVYLAQDRLFSLADGLRVDRSDDAQALDKARAQFQSFLAANRVAGGADALAPDGAATAPVAWKDAGRTLDSVALASRAGQVSVGGVRRSPGAGSPEVVASFSNPREAPAATFVPLLVISDAGGLELAEVAGEARTLAPGARIEVTLPARLGKLPHGTYFVSVIPSHPDSGRRVGVGQYHVEMAL